MSRCADTIRSATFEPSHLPSSDITARSVMYLINAHIDLIKRFVALRVQIGSGHSELDDGPVMIFQSATSSCVSPMSMALPDHLICFNLPMLSGSKHA